MNINPTKSSYNQIFKKLNPVYEHREKGLIKPQVKKYTKSDYKKNEVALYEYPSKNMVSPNSVISSNEKYQGYTKKFTKKLRRKRTKFEVKLSDMGQIHFPHSVWYPCRVPL